MKKQSRERRLHTTIHDILDAAEDENDKSVLWFAHRVNQRLEIGGKEE